MKLGFRKISLKKRIAARTSVKRFVRHNLGVKAPRGLGMVTNPKKALYNKVYNKVTVDPLKVPAKLSRGGLGCLILVFPLILIFR